MADSSDVQKALVILIADVLYPNGTAGDGGYNVAGGYGEGAGYGGAPLAPGTFTLSAAGLPVRVYRGWPVDQQLDPDLKAGIAHVTVFQANGMGRLAEGNIGGPLTFGGAPATITASVSGAVVTLGGSITPGNLVGLLIDGTAYAYRIQPGDTILTVAAALVALIGTTAFTVGGDAMVDDDGDAITFGDSVTVTPVQGGATLTIGTTRPIVARVASPGVALYRHRQQTEQQTITCWAPTPQARDAICKLVDGILSGTSWLPLCDQQARLLWCGTRSDDMASKAALWRRDIFYHVTYWTTHIQSAATMLFGDLTLTGGNGPALTFIS